MAAINSDIEKIIDSNAESCPDKQKYKIVQLSEGNPGAITVLSKVIGTTNVEKFDEVAEVLLNQDITGSDIWVKFKDQNGEDISKFIEDVLN